MIRRTVFAGFIFAFSAQADVVNLVDTFNATPLPQCTSSHQASSFVTCDVIGNRTDFDIEKATVNFNSSAITIDYYLNYRDDAVSTSEDKLKKFEVGTIDLRAGDILFTGPSDIYYGIAMSDHDSLTRGALYLLSGNPLTAHQALLSDNSASELSQALYRKDQFVWIPSGATKKGGDPTSFVITDLGTNGVTGAEYKVSIQLSATASSELFNAYNAGLANGYFKISFQSADCGNDILEQTIHTPEPADYSAMFGVFGLAALGVFRRRQAA